MPLQHVLLKAAAAAAATIVLLVPTTAAMGAPAQTASVSQSASHAKHFSKAPKPRIAGHVAPGDTLRVVTGTWRPAKVHLRVQWLLDGRAIKGATHKSYTVRNVDRSHRLSVSVRATKHGYVTRTKRSASTSVPGPVRAPRPTPITTPAPQPTAAPPAPVPTSAPAPVVTPTPAPVASTPPVPSNVVFSGDGQFIVGTGNVQPGLYVTSAATSSCYWETDSSFDGSTDSINSNDIGSGQRIMLIKPTDYGVTLHRCGSWLRSTDAPSISSISTGEYFVGQQVAQGTYQATGTQAGGAGCYWATLSGFDGSVGSIIANDYSSGGASIVTIGSDAEGFETSGCTNWTKIG